MDIRKRLFRRPLTTVLWLVMVTIMAIAIGVGAAMERSAQGLLAALDDHHTTIAVQIREVTRIDSNSFSPSNASLLAHHIEELEKMESVEMVDTRTVTGAYIPELTALIGQKDWYGIEAKTPYQSANDSYQNMILTGTVVQSWDYVETGFPADLTDYGLSQQTHARYMCCILQAEQILVGHDDFYVFPNDKYPDGYTGRVMVRALIYDDGGELYFQPGERYILSGSYDYDLYTWFDEPVTQQDYVECTSLELGTYSCGLRVGDQLHFYQTTTPASVPIDKPEFTDRHYMWSAAKLDGTVEEFLADPENAHWLDIIDRAQTALKCFPVMGTEALETMYCFVKNEASIVSGRMFTQEEYDQGAKVCVISQTLANANGIALGDTISLSQYGLSYDMRTSLFNPSLDGSSTDGILNNVSLGLSCVPESYDTENEAFTVVGLYRQQNEWLDTSFAITPNTVFIPQKAQVAGGVGGGSQVEDHYYATYQTDEQGNQISEKVMKKSETLNDAGALGVLMSVKVKNGMMERFKEELAESSLSSRSFYTYDQGFDAAKDSILPVIESARRLFAVMCGGWALLLALFTLLYQGAQRRNLGIMRSLGASPAGAGGYLFGSGMAVALVGVILGTAASGLVMELVQEKLFGFALASVDMSQFSGGTALDAGSITAMLGKTGLPARDLLILMGAQLAIIAAVLWLQARGLAKKEPRRLLGV